MKTLLLTAIRNNWYAHTSNPANLVMGACGMIGNNILFLGGMYLMIFAGKESNAPYIPYYWATNALAMISWGTLNFFSAGFRDMGQIIDNGEFETYLATPRSSLLLAGLSRSDVTAFGDVVMGLVGIIALGFAFGPEFALRTALSAAITTVALLATFIAAGSLAFFVKRGSSLAELIYFVTLSLTSYPTSVVLTGRGRLLLYLTPALATALLPIEALMNASLWSYILAIVAAGLFFAGSVQVFRLGTRRYRSASYISMRE